ncbi:helix-turn-helix domain-containing protein [Sulfuricurvum sp.]|uniref:helix-turn-helix domain-containing protein n=1 Tax=Sulfuricurvum sp. TaxID=2025608 RepID=UPI002608033F|nr:helix-turn-helix domain-containing protein [Sulfuricurvum sp.]MDD3596169.1 helix-turn-helix domain-containing protein [Sulfuricurvum sp.]
MSTRLLLDIIKEKTGIRTDKQLAEEIGVKYGALTNWIARDSFQYEPIIIFLLKKNVDLNSVFQPLLLPDLGEVIRAYKNNDISKVGYFLPRQPKSNAEEAFELDAAQTAGEIEEAYLYVAKYGNLTMLQKFKDVITGIVAMYKEQADEIKEFMK